MSRATATVVETATKKETDQPLTDAARIRELIEQHLLRYDFKDLKQIGDLLRQGRLLPAENEINRIRPGPEDKRVLVIEAIKDQFKQGHIRDAAETASRFKLAENDAAQFKSDALVGLKEQLMKDEDCNGALLTIKSFNIKPEEAKPIIIEAIKTNLDNKDLTRALEKFSKFGLKETDAKEFITELAGIIVWQIKEGNLEGAAELTSDLKKQFPSCEKELHSSAIGEIRAELEKGNVMNAISIIDSFKISDLKDIERFTETGQQALKALRPLKPAIDVLNLAMNLKLYETPLMNELALEVVNGHLRNFRVDSAIEVARITDLYGCSCDGLAAIKRSMRGHMENVTITFLEKGQTRDAVESVFEFGFSEKELMSLIVEANRRMREPKKKESPST